MSTIGNNGNLKFSQTRDSFFTDSEKEFFTKLLENPKERFIHTQLLRQKVESLYERALNLLNRVESGEFNEEQMAKVEHLIAHYLGTIQDFEKVLELELTPSLEL